MVNIDERDKKRITKSLIKLVTFCGNPGNKQAWDEARIVLDKLGSTAGRLLVDKPQEDVALTSSLTELDGFIDSLRHSQEDNDAKRRFEVSLGDVEYRVKRLFGVVIR